MSVEENKAIVRRYVEDVLIRRDETIAEAIVAPDFVDHTPLDGQAGGTEGRRQRTATVRGAFPDMEITVEHLIAEGDRVAWHFIIRATHSASFLGVEATGRRVEYTLSAIVRIADGRIAERWIIFDRLRILQQIGALKPPV
jgi:steroid delta-isomerase-like uncharacterized protein